MQQHRTAILLVILLAIMSGLYAFNKLADVPDVTDALPITTIPFDGKTPPEIDHGDTTKKQIIFTFDAGSGTESVGPILTTLKKHGVKGTFFVTGAWATQHPILVRAIVAAGNEVFNHSYSHPYFVDLTDEMITDELNHMDSVFNTITGSSTKPYFRPPYGSRNERVMRTAALTGYQSVYWTIDAGDWKEDQGMTAEEVKNKILSNLEPGMIILMHVGDTITGSILDELLTTIEGRGYKAVSLTQGL